MYVRDLAVALQERGHVPIIYSPELGDLARELHALTIPVVDDLNSIGAPPDIIHGHHHMETMTALLQFPGVPAVYFCHDWFSGLDSPPAFPRVLRYVAVDQTCFEKLIFEHAVPEERVRLLFSFIDDARFKPRAPLPAQPKHALLYCNYTTDDANLAAVREACATTGLELDVVGLGMGNASREPEKLLRDYDIVFAKSRAAAEALAVGTAVIIYCMRSAGPIVTASELEQLLPSNFGVRAMKSYTSAQSLTQHLCREIARYDARDAREASARVRHLLGREKSIDKILMLYEEVITEYRNLGTPDAVEEARAAARYIRWLSTRIRDQFNILIESPLVIADESSETALDNSGEVNSEALQERVSDQADVASSEVPEEELSDNPDAVSLQIPRETFSGNPVLTRPKRPWESIWSNPVVVSLKRRFVKIPIVGKWAHSFALRLIGPSP